MASEGYINLAATVQTGKEQAPNVRATPRTSMLRANIFAVMCICLLVGYAFLLLSPGLIWPDCPAPQAYFRVRLLFAFGLVYLFRLNAMARWLLPRELSNEELTVVPLWILSIMASYALGALPIQDALDWPLLIASSLLYITGSWFNTWSELQRKIWKAKPENKGRCYTQGLFAFSRNINYFGDVVLFAGWALATGRWWNQWVTIVMAAMFYFFHIPDKEQYLKERYAEDWLAYEQRTPSFIPFVWC